MKTEKSHIRSLLSLAVLGIFLVSGWIFRYDISDWWRLRSYEPSTVVARLSQSAGMNDYGQKLFYTAHPQISSADTFNENCRIYEFSIILGCYVSSNGLYGNIYLFDIEDERLRGILEVTAAHEMLHVAYDRLSGSERERVDALTKEAFASVKDKRIRETIAQYETQDSTSVPNELHSILATEVSSLPSELEAYYDQYFSDRKKVVTLSQQYETAFTSRQKQITQIEQRLGGLKAEIDANNARLESEFNRLQVERQAIENNPNSTQARIDSYNQDVNEYQALRSSTAALIAEYNRLVEEYNTISLEINDLYQSIDSTPGGAL